MSLRPKLHVSTFHWRTVVSMIGRLCHLFVHALSSLQVANAQCMTLRSLAPCLRAAREKHRFAAGKKHRNGKKHVWQQEKNALQREKAISAAGKTPAKNAASQREKFKAAEKTPCSSTKAPLQQKKCILEAAGKKPSEAGKKPVRGKKKTGRGRKKNQQQRKSSFATQKVAATEKIHFRNGKKQQPCAKKTPNTVPSHAQLKKAFSRSHFLGPSAGAKSEIAKSLKSRAFCIKKFGPPKSFHSFPPFMSSLRPRVASFLHHHLWTQVVQYVSG